MKLNEALQAAAGARNHPISHRAFLACGVEPLHLPVFLQAHHAARFPGQGLAVEVGVFGDLLGNVERAGNSEATVAWVVLEWGDVDPRLGLRSTGAWTGAAAASPLADAAERLGRLEVAIERVAGRIPVIVSPPSVPFPILGHTSGWQASSLELELELLLVRFCAALARYPRVRVLHAGRLAASSPLATRSDPRLELAAGFPYTSEHASALARGLLELAYPRAPKKGLITDLDDTLWAGLVGEVGAEAVSWTQAERSQLHGIYQLFLRQLAEAGVLLAVATKNEEDVVKLALARRDLLIDGATFYPVAASWGPKSEAVTAILRTWNIGADAVVVVDDSRMELEEIQRVHPGITGLEFAPKDPKRTLELMVALRDAFGKPTLLEEDKLRAASIRGAQQFERQRTGADLESFIAGLEGRITFEGRRAGNSERWFELLNKTNQFNLNGERLSEGEWMRLMQSDDHIAVGIAYSDRYGPLGTIGLVVGRLGAEGTGPERVLHVQHWVLSCRAFSRRIEDHTLAHLFASMSCDYVQLQYRSTTKNRPFQEFLGRLGIAAAVDGPLQVGRAELARVANHLPHRTVLAEAGPERRHE